MTKHLDVSSLRKEYSQAQLDINSVSESPFDQFEKWFDQAVKSELLEPNAMVLSTSDGKGNISQRTVLLKGMDAMGYTFYTNYKSKKSKQIETNNRVSVLFPWYGLERQVSIAGVAQKINPAESLKYFISRPFGSQLGAWVSAQSQVISSRSILESKLHEMKQKFKEGKVPLPDFWGGYKIIPDRFEFWQGRQNRLHDRIQFSKEESTWIKERLSP